MKQKIWTIKNIKDQTGKVMIVTGANSGIGFETAKVFAKFNAHVILACRNLEKAQKAYREITNEVKHAQLTIIQLDLADLSSVQSFVDQFKKSFKRLDVLVNNAGIMNVPYMKTKDGLEMQNGVNHLGHFTLTALLFDILKKTKKSRVVNVSSIMHKYGKLNFENYLYENGRYTGLRSYGRSKLSNLLFTYELQRRIENKGLDIIATASHPGTSDTNLVNHKKRGFIGWILGFSKYVAQSQERGALPTIRAALDEDVKSGQYYGPDGFNEMRGNPIVVKSSKKSHDLKSAKRLWEVSEKLTKVKFTL